MKKVALLFVCLNSPYWPYLKQVIEDCREHFLKGHQVDYFSWTDIPPEVNYGATVFETDPAPWPMPTLMRYTLFLRQEEQLSEYDYIFYLDADMRVVADITDEIMGEGLTAALHPMYAFRPGLRFPLEPNPNSTAYIKVPQHYFAGGFQGGRSKDFIAAMKVMKKNIDTDFKNNYVARWNDESHWNRYLFDNPPAVILDQTYIYPDSLIDSYYVPIWGYKPEPKIITLTKPFTVSKEGGEAARNFAEDLSKLK